MVVIFGKRWTTVLCVFTLLVAVSKPFIAWLRHHRMTGDQWFDTAYLAALGAILLVKNLQRAD
jgi:hypothetical protein